MTWSYSGNPSNSYIDEIRFILGDTDSAHPLLQDEEIEFLYTKYNDVNTVVYYALDNIIAKVTREVTKEFGPEKIQYSDVFKHYMELKKLYQGKLGGLGIPSMETPHDMIFDIGMMNNNNV